MSWEEVAQAMSVTPGAKAEQTSRRCASDLEEGAASSPERGPGPTVTSTLTPPFRAR